MTFRGLFPDADYRFQMRFQRATPAEFFQLPSQGATVLAQRRRWLHEQADQYAGLRPEGISLLEEMVAHLSRWTPQAVAGFAPDAAPWTQLLELGARLDTDFLLLNLEPAGAARLAAGCVCFPSSWSLAEKIGHPVEVIHGVVPGLNDQLSAPISQFLRRMPPETAWLRANWGLSRSPELNQHPDRRLPKLDAKVTLAEVWLRVEDQALISLPRTGGVLFGIRVTVVPLPVVVTDPEAAHGLRRALETMPEPMAVYKGIASARPALLHQLEQRTA